MKVNLELHERHCIRCKKEFIAREGWAYKIGKGSNEKLFCSWGCLRAWEKTGTKAERRERIIKAINEGKSTAEIVHSLHEDKSHVLYWKNKMGVTA